MTQQSFSETEWAAIDQAITRLRASVMSVTFAIAGGAGMLIATAWLLVHAAITNASNVGATLNLLNNYFPGYSVTWVGAFVGAFYGAALGALLGYLLATIYNKVASRRS